MIDLTNRVRRARTLALAGATCVLTRLFQMNESAGVQYATPHHLRPGDSSQKCQTARAINASVMDR
jgi:hypothetical protein